MIHRIENYTMNVCFGSIKVYIMPSVLCSNHPRSLHLSGHAWKIPLL
jgi:hypothetical protein